ncbi:unnamed protein product [Lymnaea stagnalis]|uniref:Histone-lysine N-methyltransferase SETMAR n=1 Tax=Lymnaea stagnalis TaxID=6523 RepID=A0AAV2H0R1_LYMST
MENISLPKSCLPNTGISCGIEKIQIFGEISIDKVFKYSKTNIPGPGSITDDFTEQYQGCKCKGNCTLNSCACLQCFGVAYNQDGKIKENILKETSQPILECGINCKCDPNLCENRVVQKGINNKLEVFQTATKGYGLRLYEGCISKLSFVCEYAGEVIDQKEARQRLELAEAAKEDNYLIVVREYVSEKILCTCIDPRHIGNVGRFINHSCHPNLIMVPVRINHSVPRLALFACRDISEKEELTFDYKGATSLHMSTKDKLPKVSEGSINPDEYTNIFSRPKKICKCGSENCTGFLPFESQLLCD